MKKLLISFTASLLAVLNLSAEAPRSFVTEVNDSVPLTIYLPDDSVATGMMIVACPGGGYVYKAIGHEGHDFAPWLLEHGIGLAVLDYRLPEGNPSVPLSDVWAAVTSVRTSADTKGYAEKIGLMGSSAGGHLAATATVLAPDSISRPDFQLLFYPVISLDDATITHEGSRDALLGADASQELRAHYTPTHHVNASTPPAFIMLSNDDWLVPAANGVGFYQALNNARTNSVLHIYPTLGHGWGVRETPFSNLWKQELLYWLSTL